MIASPKIFLRPTHHRNHQTTPFLLSSSFSNPPPSPTTVQTSREPPQPLFSLSIPPTSSILFLCSYSLLHYFLYFCVVSYDLFYHYNYLLFLSICICFICCWFYVCFGDYLILSRLYFAMIMIEFGKEHKFKNMKMNRNGSYD